MTPYTGLDNGGGEVHYRTMSKLSALLILLFVVAVFAFGTWQMFAGNLEAAFIALPFLVIIYLFVKRNRP